jgi:hypothetical protein
MNHSYISQERDIERVLLLCSLYMAQKCQVPAMMEHARVLQELSEARPVQTFLFSQEGACQLHQDP